MMKIYRQKKTSAVTRWLLEKNAWLRPTFTQGILHYHRRYKVSLLSSVWSQVGPKHYSNQANLTEKKEISNANNRTLSRLE